MSTERRGFLKTILALPFAAKAGAGGGMVPGEVAVKLSPATFRFVSASQAMQEGKALVAAQLGARSLGRVVRGVTTNIPVLDQFAWLDREVCDQAADSFTPTLPAPGERSELCPDTLTAVTIVSPSTTFSTP